MKILQVITSLHVGGAEKLIVDMVPLYREQGHQVDVLLFDGTETPFKKRLRDKGVTIYEFGKGGSVYNPLYIFKLIPFLRKYDIVHTHNTASQLFAAFGSVLCSVVLVTTEHNTSNRRRNLMCYKLLDKWMYGRYRSVICISDKTKENLIEYLGFELSSVPIIYNGINSDVYRRTLVCSAMKDCEKTIVTMVAGFRNQKDQDTLIKAFQYLPTDKYELWLVGDGKRRSVLEDLVSRLGLQDIVRFWGIRSDVPEILKTSDIVVMSSHWEGFGLAAVEGMAAGKPVVATDVPGLAEVVKGAGILFPHEDEKTLAFVLRQLMEDKTYYQQIVNQCMLRVSQYDIRKTVGAYLEIYKKLV
jgi:glycosyltransferase involved in cell wall biosynthesis